LEVDGQNRARPDDRKCWFTGDDGAAAVARLSDAETADAPRTRQDAVEFGGKRPVRCFVSYAHDDRTLKDDLVRRLRPLFVAAKTYRMATRKGYPAPTAPGLVFDGKSSAPSGQSHGGHWQRSTCIIVVWPVVFFTNLIYREGDGRMADGTGSSGQSTQKSRTPTFWVFSGVLMAFLALTAMSGWYFTVKLAEIAPILAAEGALIFFSAVIVERTLLSEIGNKLADKVEVVIERSLDDARYSAQYDVHILPPRRSSVKNPGVSYKKISGLP
jgi:hypothetical protein